VATLTPTLTTELNQLDIVVDQLNAAVGLVTADLQVQAGIVGSALGGILNGLLPAVICPAVESLLATVSTLTSEGGKTCRISISAGGRE
jgi:tetrahydromethanopterin S-methyltransferase subunit F